jgi:hypothetical protein
MKKKKENDFLFLLLKIVLKNKNEKPFAKEARKLQETAKFTQKSL